MVEALKLNQVIITSPFWQRYRKMIAEKAVPFQWKMISDQSSPETTDAMAAGGSTKNSNAIKNLKIAAGLEKGNHHGMIFQDTDVYKWLETVAYVLKYSPSDKLQKLADQVVELIAKAQDADGYLSTRYQIDTPKLKFKQLQQSHELYSMGHYIEAGVAYYLTTGNKTAIMIAEKIADCIDQKFGERVDKIHGYDGHPEIELALAKLYECTKNKKYLDLANYFVQIRGTDSAFFARQNKDNDIKYDPFPEMRHATNNYFFDEKPVQKQKMVQGHAVRVLYYLTGMMHIARLTDNDELKKAAKRLWNDIVQKQMYITGNVGQTATGEAFTYDYDLPNLTDYGETCASVSMVFFARQMLDEHFSGEYGDIIEKELYNGALAGISLDGEHYFYANALEFSKNSRLNPASSHLTNKRLSWFSCACCPANITRLIASVDQYIFALKGNEILLDQLISNKTRFSNNITVSVDSNMPWGNKIDVSINNPNHYNFKFKIRVPEWSKTFKVEINGQGKRLVKTDGIIAFDINENTIINLTLDNSIKIIHANPLVVADQGKAAIQKGPFIYCAEQVDNPGNYANYCLPNKTIIKSQFESKLLEGIEIITIDNAKYQKLDNLYSDTKNYKKSGTKLKLIPYFAWANRKPGSMMVWIRQEG